MANRMRRPRPAPWRRELGAVQGRLKALEERIGDTEEHAGEMAKHFLNRFSTLDRLIGSANMAAHSRLTGIERQMQDLESRSIRNAANLMPLYRAAIAMRALCDEVEGRLKLIEAEEVKHG